jgi:hypothetical protein
MPQDNVEITFLGKFHPFIFLTCALFDEKLTPAGRRDVITTLIRIRILEMILF